MGKAVAQVYWMRERLLKREVIATKDEEWQPLVGREWDEWDDKVNFQDNRMKEDGQGYCPTGREKGFSIGPKRTSPPNLMSLPQMTRSGNLQYDENRMSGTIK